MLDWIAREGWILSSWWLLVTLAGLAVLPLCWRLFHALPDKGYTIARAAGLLLVGFVYWIMAIFGFVENSTGGIILAWLLVVALSLAAFFRFRTGDFDLRQYWRENRRVILVAEILFIVLLASWALYRAYQNDTGSTEKPMELAFISGIMRSDTFPPNDPWMAGYAISYYHFGYIMAAMLSMVSGVSSAVGFSMTIATWFALTGLTVFGVVYNLVRSRTVASREQREPAPGRNPAIFTGILAVVFVLLLGNFQLPLIELPYQARAASPEYLDFWGIDGRTGENYVAPVAGNDDFSVLDPTTWVTPNWWWFRASRVLTDYNLDGTRATHAQPIDEFPAFSFVLSDAHPHVLALPFVALALATMLNLVLGSRAPYRYEILWFGLLVGGLVFLNTWDGAIYLVALVGAEALRRVIVSGRLVGRDWIDLIFFGAGVLLIAIVAYLPFLIGFRSQAAGFLPNLAHPTLFRRFFIMFGPLLLLIFPFLGMEVWRGIRSRRMNWALGLQAALGVLLALVGVIALLAILASFVPSLRDVVLGFVGRNGGWEVVLPQLLERRLTYGLTSLVMLVGIALVVARLFPPIQRKRHSEDDDTIPDPDRERHNVKYPAATGFALLLLGIGFSLVLLPDFIYLRDNFAVRINTVFKFYYQTWIVFSIVGAYAVYSLVLDQQEERPVAVLRYGFSAVLVIVLLLGLLYPVLAFHSRAMIETGYYARGVDNPPVLTLDGSSRMPLTRDDYAAIQCLANLVEGDDAVVAEAVQLAYRSHYARVGSITGIPIVIGWENHERQWRGATYDAIAGTRAADINELYTDLRWDIALPILERYGIDYIFFGATERDQYGSAGETKFQENLQVVCESGATRVYYVGEDALTIAQP